MTLRDLLTWAAAGNNSSASFARLALAVTFDSPLPDIRHSLTETILLAQPEGGHAYHIDMLTHHWAFGEDFGCRCVNDQSRFSLSKYMIRCRKSYDAARVGLAQSTTIRKLAVSHTWFVFGKVVG